MGGKKETDLGISHVMFLMVSYGELCPFPAFFFSFQLVPFPTSMPTICVTAVFNTNLRLFYLRIRFTASGSLLAPNSHANPQLYFLVSVSISAMSNPAFVVQDWKKV